MRAQVVDLLEQHLIQKTPGAPRTKRVDYIKARGSSTFDTGFAIELATDAHLANKFMAPVRSSHDATRRIVDAWRAFDGRARAHAAARNARRAAPAGSTHPWDDAAPVDFVLANRTVDRRVVGCGIDEDADARPGTDHAPVWVELEFG